MQTQISECTQSYQAPLSQVDEGAIFAARRYTEAVEPEDLSVIHRRLFEAAPSNFDWVSKQFQDLPDYLMKYFAAKYVELCTNHTIKAANIYIRKRMQPAAKRAHLVMHQYRHLPTTNKIISLKARFESIDDENANVDQSDWVKTPTEQQKSFDFESIEKYNKPKRNRTLAEMEQDELKDMAFVMSTCVNHFFLDLSGGNKLETDVELTQESLETYHTIAIVLAYEDVANLVSSFGINPPRKYKKQTELSALQDISKMISESWWLNRLKKARKIMREHLAIAMGQVSARASTYASWDCISEHQAQQKKNWDFIQNAMLFDAETGDETELKDMVLKSVSNPAIRRHELMVRTRGCENIGDSLGLQGLFLTLTTPGSYHNSYKKGGFIPHWNGKSPREAQRYLNNVWQRIRAKLGREEIRWFGIRVAEPHHDGTPHWHLLIWVKPEQVDAVKDIFIDYATKEDRHELMTSGKFDYLTRCDVTDIDPEKGTATGYIAKYISKNIDGFAMDDEISDENEKPVKEMAKNVTAWKSRWNIRQFQFFGGAPVTTYRELRRFASQNKKAFMEYVFMQDRAALIDMYGLMHYRFMGPIKPAGFLTNMELMEAIGNSYESRIDSKHSAVSGAMKAADHGNWMGYIMGQGGPFVKRDDLLIRNEYKTMPYASPHGEDVKKIEGFTAMGESWQTRLREWQILSKRTLEQLKESNQTEAKSSCSSAFDFALAGKGSAASPWSSVNNCTDADPVVNPRLVIEAVSSILSKNETIDEISLKALCKGASVHLGSGQYIRLRNPKHSAELVMFDHDRYEEQEFLDRMGWNEQPDPSSQQPKPPQMWQQHNQPDLLPPSDFHSEVGEWPLV